MVYKAHICHWCKIGAANKNMQLSLLAQLDGESTVVSPSPDFCKEKDWAVGSALQIA